MFSSALLEFFAFSTTPGFIVDCSTRTGKLFLHVDVALLQRAAKCFTRIKVVETGVIIGVFGGFGHVLELREIKRGVGEKS